MTGAVLLDDAWAGCATPAAADDGGGGWGYGSTTTATGAPVSEERAARAEADAGRAARAQTRRAGRVRVDDVPEREQRASSRSDADNARAMQRLCQELSRVRQALDERDGTQAVVLYSALAVILILLILVLQAFFKLQHASECLLWYRRM